MVDSDRHMFIKHLIANIKCAVCQHQYEPADIQIIERHEELWVLGVTCSECETQGLIFAIIREVSADISRSLDMDEEDRGEPEIMAGINADEILDMHCLLRNFNGDVYDLLLLFD